MRKFLSTMMAGLVLLAGCNLFEEIDTTDIETGADIGAADVGHFDMSPSEDMNSDAEPGADLIEQEDMAVEMAEDLGVDMAPDGLSCNEGDVWSTLNGELVDIVEDCPGDCVYEQCVGAQILAFWRFETIDQNRLLDEYGTNNATADGVTLTDGARGNAARFSTQSDSRIASVRTKTWNSFSMSLWFRSQATMLTDDMYFFEHEKDVRNIALAITDDAGQTGKVRATVEDDDRFLKTYFDTPDLMDGEWHHIGFARNVDDASVRLWVDGVELPSQVDQSGGAPIMIVDGTASLGMAQEGTDHLRGDIDEFVFFDDAIDSMDVSVLFNSE